MDQDQRSWPSAAVAIAIMALIGAVTIKAIDKYTAAEAIQIWGELGVLVGVVTGAIATYFFTRATVQNAQTQAKNAMAMAAQQAQRASDAELALAQTRGILTPQQREALMADAGLPAAGNAKLAAGS